MIRSFIWIFVVLFFLLINGAYAYEINSGKLIKHKEWLTGAMKLKYTLSDTIQKESSYFSHDKRKIYSDYQNYIHSVPEISNIHTTYEKSRVITKIRSAFLVEARGFDANNQPQIFEVYRQTCIDPGDTGSEQATCVNSEDMIELDDILFLNVVSMNIEAYNLPPGKYIASAEMYVKQIYPHSEPSIAYLTTNKGIEFTLQDK